MYRYPSTNWCLFVVAPPSLSKENHLSPCEEGGDTSCIHVSAPGYRKHWQDPEPRCVAHACHPARAEFAAGRPYPYSPEEAPETEYEWGEVALLRIPFLQKHRGRGAVRACEAQPVHTQVLRRGGNCPWRYLSRIYSERTFCYLGENTIFPAAEQAKNKRAATHRCEQQRVCSDSKLCFTSAHPELPLPAACSRANPACR